MGRFAVYADNGQLCCSWLYGSGSRPHAHAPPLWRRLATSSGQAAGARNLEQEWFRHGAAQCKVDRDESFEHGDICTLCRLSAVKMVRWLPDSYTRDLPRGMQFAIQKTLFDGAFLFLGQMTLLQQMGRDEENEFGFRTGLGSTAEHRTDQGQVSQ